MVFGYLIVAILAAAVAVFALQNSDPTTIRFLSWTLPSLSIGAVVLMALVVGMVIAGLPLFIQGAMLRRKVRRLEDGMSTLEHSLKERDRALMAMRPERRVPSADSMRGHSDDIPA